MDIAIKGFLRDLFAIKYDSKANDPEAVCIDGDGRCYPNCDSSVWLRSCEKEIIEPLYGKLQGSIPKWLNGSLLRNGPGNLKFGEMQYQHIFDSSALLHRFAIKDGQVTYQCRFIQTETFKRNMTAQRIVFAEFGTHAAPDPCHSIFQKVSAIFKKDETSDNTMISIYPFGDEYYTFTESPVMHRINPVTLETEAKLMVSDFIGIASHTSHPHIMKDGTVYNLGLGITKTGPAYHILCFPHGDRMFENARIVATVPCRWKFHPGYMHTFAITENYFLIVEQPLSISLPEWTKTQLMHKPTSSCLKWFENKCTYFYLIERSTGVLKSTYKAEAFFYLHIINQYEHNYHVIIDICCYKDPSILNCMYVESMMNMQNNPNYAAMFRGRPLRFSLPLAKEKSKCAKLIKSSTFSNFFDRFRLISTLRRSESELKDIQCAAFIDLEKKNYSQSKKISCSNLLTLSDTTAHSCKMLDDGTYVQPKLLCDLGCETPRINYEQHFGVPYRYFYAISSDVDAENPGTLIKVDTVTNSKQTWCEPNCYPSEPIFVPSPESEDEDDGIILAAMVWGNLEENRVGLLVLCARNFIEIGRCEFQTPGPVPKCLHGWFAPNKDLHLQK